MFTSAEAYERFMGRWSRALAPELLTFAGGRAGDAVLDVGCGTGALLFALQAADPSARIVGVDRSSEYIDLAARRSRGRGVILQVADAERLPFVDADFDRALSMLVLNFVPDPARALAEMTRVTRAGGTVAAAVWDYAAGMEMLRIFWDEALALDPASAARDEGRMPLAREGELAALWAAQGLLEVVSRPLTVPLPFASFDDYWGPFLLGQGPAGAYVVGLASDRQALLAERLRRRLLGAGDDRAFTLAGRAWAARGVVAAARPA